MDFPTYAPTGLQIWVENPKYFCYFVSSSIDDLDRNTYSFLARGEYFA